MARLRENSEQTPTGQGHASAALQLPVSGFGSGTLIETDDGPIPVDWLRAGDRVLTYHNGFQPVRWVGRDCLRQAPQDVASISLEPRAGADRRKPKPTVLAARHRLLLAGWHIQLHFGVDAILAEARDLGITPDHFPPVAVGFTACALVLLDRPQVIQANGFWVESLQLTSGVRDCLDDKANAALERLPLDQAAHVKPAASCLHAWEARDLGLDLIKMIAPQTDQTG